MTALNQSTALLIIVAPKYSSPRFFDSGFVSKRNQIKPENVYRRQLLAPYKARRNANKINGHNRRRNV